MTKSMVAVSFLAIDLFIEGASLSSATRLPALGSALAAILGFQGLAQASYTYTSIITPDPVTSSSGLSQVSFSTISGDPIAIDGKLHPIALSVIHATSSATSAESLISAPIVDTLTIFDGGQTGVFTFTMTCTGSKITSTGGSYSFGIPFFSSHKIVINGDTFTCNQFNSGLPKTNGADSQFSTDITAIPGVASVPEPSSLVLIGMAGVAILLSRRFRTILNSNQPGISVHP